MCGPYIRFNEASSPSNTDNQTAFEKKLSPRQRLAYLFARDMGADMDPDALAEFIKRNWSKVSVCAHAIHDEPNLDAVSANADRYRMHVPEGK